MVIRVTSYIHFSSSTLLFHFISDPFIKFDPLKKRLPLKWQKYKLTHHLSPFLISAFFKHFFWFRFINMFYITTFLQKFLSAQLNSCQVSKFFFAWHRPPFFRKENFWYFWRNKNLFIANWSLLRILLSNVCHPSLCSMPFWNEFHPHNISDTAKTSNSLQ